MFNPKLFRKNKGYNPHLSIITTIEDSCVISDCVRLTLDDLSTVTLSTTSFLNYIIANKISLTNNSFTFPIILDYQNKPHTSKEYEDWKNIVENNENIALSFNDLVPGSFYELDDKTAFFFYGKKYVISYKVSSAGILSITKTQEKYICYTVYKNDNYRIDRTSLYEGKVFYLTNKNKVVKQLKGNNIEIIPSISNLLKFKKNFLYCEDNKPLTNKTEIELEEISIQNISELKNDDINHIECFHQLQSGYIAFNRSLYITDNFLNNRDYSRQFNRTYIYDQDFKFKEMQYFSSRDWMTEGHILFGLQSCYDNDNFRLCPDKYCCH